MDRRIDLLAPQAESVRKSNDDRLIGQEFSPSVLSDEIKIQLWSHRQRSEADFENYVSDLPCSKRPHARRYVEILWRKPQFAPQRNRRLSAHDLGRAHIVADALHRLRNRQTNLPKYAVRELLESVEPEIRRAGQRLLQRTMRNSLNHHAGLGQAVPLALRSETGTNTAPELASETIPSASGAALDPSTQRYMEQLFGVSLATVTVHTDSGAAQFCRALGARAVTLASKIYFAHGQYNPATLVGRRLIAHEITHYVQFLRGQIPHSHDGKLHVLDRHHPLEQAARAVEDKVVSITPSSTAQRAVRTTNQIAPAQTGRPVAARSSWWDDAKSWAKDKALSWAKGIIAGWGIDPERFLALFAKVGDVVAMVKKVASAPGEFFQNLVRALIGGAEEFWAKKWEHLRSGVIEWLTGRTGISITEFSASGMLHMLMQVVGLGAQTLEAKAKAQIQKRHAEDEKKAEVQTQAAVTAEVDRTVESEAKRRGVGGGRLGALKEKAQARVKQQGVFGQVWGYVREKIRVLFQSGFRGLFESLAGDIKSLFTGLFQEILREVWERALVEGAKMALMLAVPFGAIIKVAQTVWRGVQWLIDQGGKLLGILETIADAMTDIVGGVIRPAAARVTDVLKRLLAPLLDGLRRLIGLPNFTQKIADFCTRIATRVQTAFVGLVNRVYDKAASLFRRKEVAKPRVDEQKPKPEGPSSGREATAMGTMGRVRKYALHLWHGALHHLIIPANPKQPFMMASTPRRMLKSSFDPSVVQLEQAIILKSGMREDALADRWNDWSHVEQLAETAQAVRGHEGEHNAIIALQSAIEAYCKKWQISTPGEASSLKDVSGEEIALALAGKIEGSSTTRQYSEAALQAEFIRRYQPMVLKLAQKIVMDPTAAQDVCAIVFRELFVSDGAAAIKNYANPNNNFSNGSIYLFLSVITKSMAINYRRTAIAEKNRYSSIEDHPHLTDNTNELAVTDELANKQQKAMVQEQMLRVISPAEYEVAVLIGLELKNSDIQKILALTEAQVRTYEQTGHAKLRKRLSALTDVSLKLSTRKELRMTYEPGAIGYGPDGPARVKKVREDLRQRVLTFRGLKESVMNDGNLKNLPADIANAISSSPHGWFQTESLKLDLSTATTYEASNPNRDRTQRFVKLKHGARNWYHLFFESPTNQAIFEFIESNDWVREVFVMSLDNNGHLFEAEIDSTRRAQMRSLIARNIFREESPHPTGRHYLLCWGLKSATTPSPKRTPDTGHQKLPEEIRQRALQNAHGWFKVAGLSKELGTLAESVAGDRFALLVKLRARPSGSLRLRHNWYHVLPNPIPDDLWQTQEFHQITYNVLEQGGRVNGADVEENEFFSHLVARGLFRLIDGNWVLQGPPYVTHPDATTGNLPEIASPVTAKRETMPPQIQTAINKSPYGWFRNRDVDSNLNSPARKFVKRYSTENSGNSRRFVSLLNKHDTWYHAKFQDKKGIALYEELMGDSAKQQIFLRALDNQGYVSSDELPVQKDTSIMDKWVTAEVFRPIVDTDGQSWVLIFGLAPGTEPPPRSSNANEKIPEAVLERTRSSSHGWFLSAGLPKKSQAFLNVHTERVTQERRGKKYFTKLTVPDVHHGWFHLLPNPFPQDLWASPQFRATLFQALESKGNVSPEDAHKNPDFMTYVNRKIFAKQGLLWSLQPPPYSRE